MLIFFVWFQFYRIRTLRGKNENLSLDTLLFPLCFPSILLHVQMTFEIKSFREKIATQENKTWTVNLVFPIFPFFPSLLTVSLLYKPIKVVMFFILLWQ